MKLTKREVTLLFLLGVVALLYFGITYLIFPQYNSNLDKQASVMALSDQLAGLNADSGTTGSIDAQIDQAKAKAVELGKPFRSSFDREQVDYWLNSLIKQNGLAKFSIEFSDMVVSGTDFNAQRTLPDSQKLQLPIQNTVNSINGAAGPVPVPAPAPTPAATPAASGVPAPGATPAANAGPQMYSLPVVLNITGSYYNISRFLDALYASGRSLAVDSLTINDFESGGKMAVLNMRFFGVPLMDQGSTQMVDFPKPAGRTTLMNENPAPTPAPSASASSGS